MLIFLVILTFGSTIKPSNGASAGLVSPLNVIQEGILGCGVIAYKINMNKSNSWQAIPDTVRPQISMFGFTKVIRKLIEDEVNIHIKYEESERCPSDLCNIPPAYDARLIYPQCPSIKLPLDEGCHCRGSWAVSAASAFTDRMCINSDGYFTDILSAQNLLSCCNYCVRKNGCEGGDSVFAWVYMHETGLVTGSSYQSRNGCQPYELIPCEAEYLSNKTSYTPSCSNECQSGFSPIDGEKFKTETAFVMRDIDVKTIKREIMLEGPVTAEIKVYEDLHCYYSGIYEHVLGNFLGFKSIKLIGWDEDVEYGPYWIAVNTWGSSWGEDGFFKIKMGTDESNVEFTVSGGRAPTLTSVNEVD